MSFRTENVQTGNLNIGGNYQQSTYFQRFVSAPANISDGNSLNVVFEATGDVVGYIHIILSGQVSDTAKSNSVEHSGSYTLYNNALTDNNIALVKKDGGENITLSVTAVGSNNQINVTITNNGGATLIYQTLMVEFLSKLSTWSAV